MQALQPLPQGSLFAPDDLAPSLVRMPILDARRRVVAWELVDLGRESRSPHRQAEMLLHALTLAGAGKAMRKRLLFIRCPLELLVSGQLDALNPAQVVIDVDLPAEPDEAAVAFFDVLLGQAREQGFRIAMNQLALVAAWQPCLAHASYMKVDVSVLPPGAVAAVVKTGRRRDGLTLIATGVQTQAAYSSAIEQGFALAQGPFFARPMPVRNRTLKPSHAAVLEIIALVRNGADPSRIESVLKRDAAMSIELLRLINSSNFGLSSEITSFRHALMILGTQKLLKWCCLLLVTARDGASPAIGHTAVVRGRLMEMLAQPLLPPEECEHAFVAGVFSLLEAMTGVELRAALAGLPLPQPILDALLSDAGTIAPILALAQACETADAAQFSHWANALGLSNHEVNMAHLQALAWAEELIA